MTGFLVRASSGFRLPASRFALRRDKSRYTVTGRQPGCAVTKAGAVTHHRDWVAVRQGSPVSTAHFL